MVGKLLEDNKAYSRTYLIFAISFTLAGFSKTKFYTQKKRQKAPKTLKMSQKKSNICIFSLILEKFTPDRKLTNKRYDLHTVAKSLMLVTSINILPH